MRSPSLSRDPILTMCMLACSLARPGQVELVLPLRVTSRYGGAVRRINASDGLHVLALSGIGTVQLEAQGIRALRQCVELAGDVGQKPRRLRRLLGRGRAPAMDKVMMVMIECARRFHDAPR